MSYTLQAIVVGIIVIAAAVLLVRALRKNDCCNDQCSNCTLKDECKNQK